MGGPWRGRALRWLDVLLLALLLSAVPLRRAVSAATPAATVERVAVLVAANDGGQDRVTLRYAESDAMQLGAVLTQVGGVQRDHVFYVPNASPARIERALARAAKRIQELRSGGARVEFVFYYSGHSDRSGLLLGDERMSYEAVRKALDRVPAAVRIAILDSCASGAFTRGKGGVRKAAFLQGSTSDIEGHAFLTSSSAAETAQESDRIGGSFFTHFLVTGLRGAADQDRDRRVTLSEAYRFAYDETLAQTQDAGSGPQHATYDIRLSGAGELVMTDLRDATGRLLLAGELSGRTWIRSRHGRLAAELILPEDDEPVWLALEPDRYEVTVDDPRAGLRQGAVEIPDGGQATLERAAMHPIARDRSVARGTSGAAPYLRIPVSIGLIPALRIGGANHRLIVNYSAALLWSHAARVHGVGMALAVDVATEEVQGAQWTALGNVNLGTLTGAQLTLGVNWASAQARGAQLSLLGNGAGSVQGVQLSVGVNGAGALRGAQIGNVNVVRGDLRGAQIGLINVGRHVRGAQVGLINIARSSDASIGLFSVTREGGIRPEVWTSDVAAINVGVRFGARYTYSLLAIGLHPAGRGAGWSFGAGVGVHAPLGRRAAIDFDLSGHATFVDLQFAHRIGFLCVARLLFAWRFYPRLALFGGPTFNLQHDDPRDGTGRLGYGWTVWQRTDEEGDDRLMLWPGFAVGLRF